MNNALLILSFLTLLSAASRIHVPGFGAAVTNSVYSSQTIPRASTELVQSPRDTALSFAKKQFNLKEGDFVVKRAYQTAHNGVTHVYLRQILQGTEVANGDMNINVDKNGNILSYGSSFLPVNAQVLSKSKTWTAGNAKFVTPTQALKTLAAHLKVPLDTATIKERSSATEGSRPSFKLDGVSFAKGDVVAEQTYVQDNGALVATWRINVPMEENWFDAQVSADGSKVLQLNDWVADANASFNVFPFNELAQPDVVGRRKVDITDNKASPKGWFDQGEKQFTTTIGNNAYAQENWSGGSAYLTNGRPDGGADHVFDFPYDDKEVDPKKYINATVSNLFYMTNTVHDLFYTYGFDEVSGNFQQNNWGKGGKGNDYVIANAQDGSGTNNANFATPPDGQNGRMRMYVFTLTTPKRDGDFSNDIIIHEYAHGLSNRLTGGPDNSNCLGWGESGGMGEGWGDWFGQVIQLKANDKEDKDMVEGSWVLGQSGGKTIRKFKYSTDMKTNPTTYAYLNQAGWSEVHAIGEIWANILYQMYHNLVKATKNYNPDFFSGDKTAGNTLALQIVIDGMKLQPCSPNFVSARDAILKAEEVATGGQYKCAIWSAFAKRGVGAAAKSAKPIVADFTVPDGCKADTTTPTEPKPEEPKPTDPKPEEPKPTEPKPTEPKPEEPKPTEPKPTEPKPTEPKPTEPKPTEPAPSKFNPSA